MLLCLCGDVMTGRGVDQILPHAGDPRLHEPYVSDAREYVELADARSGRIPRPVSWAYVWGDALAERDRLAAAAWIVNLETSITRADDVWRGKDVHYRMHPANVACLTAAGIDVCVLANNHVLDYGRDGLVETLDTLRQAGIAVAGAGRTRDEARRPAILERQDGRVVVFAFGVETSGIPPDWAATDRRPGVDLLDDLSPVTADAVARQVRLARQPGDVIVASIHWGPNWVDRIPDVHTRFAHALIDGGVHIVHGHSSHHPLAIEVYRGGLVLYGCRDFVDDYEGIAGDRSYRSDLVLMYAATVDARTGGLAAVHLTPLQLRRMRLGLASPADRQWLQRRLDAEGRRFGTRVEAAPDGRLAVRW
ncbi:MAG TPA: CapA family protein [Vicinamibacterales bacterium]|nr:CapA family protein [Vicinamibacterales bacterium]